MAQPERKGPVNGAATAWRLFQYVYKEYLGLFVLVLVCIGIAAVASVAGSLFLRTLIDNYITPLVKSGSRDFGPLLHALLVMAAIYYAGVIATLIQARVMVTISQGVQRSIRDTMFSNMQQLPVGYFDTHSYGDVMSRYTNDIDTLRQMLSQSIPMVISSLVTIVVVFIAMLHASLIMTAIVAAVALVAVLASRIVTGRSRRYFVQQQADLGEINGYIEEMMNGQKVVKVFCYEREAERSFDVLNQKWCDSATNANKYANILMPLMINLGNLQFVLVAVVGGALAVHGGYGLTVGIIASFLQLSRSISMPINQVSQQLNSVIMALAGAERIFQLMDEEPEQDDGYVTLVNIKKNGDQLVETQERTGLWAWKHPHQAGGLTYTPQAGDVRFVDVRLGYVQEKTELNDNYLYALPGEKVAFVGSTGAGKTTMTNLINRFYTIQEGKIRYDTINIEKIKKADLRRSLGMVLQETNLFTGTIMDNIRYGRLDATDEEIHKAAELANANCFIHLLPHGYDTVLSNDGGELSQGQRQLIAIARAAVADPPVMILDEATSSIDTRTESIVQKGMDSLMHGRTVFVIAHRLSTVRNADVIMVLENGRIIERGNHQQLMELKQRYYQLYTGATELQ